MYIAKTTTNTPPSPSLPSHPTDRLLQRREKEFKALFDQSNDGIIIVREGKFTDCNQQISKMFGYTRDEFIQNTPRELSPEYQPSGKKSLDGIGAKIQNALAGDVQEFYWKHKRRNGELFDTDVTVSRFDIEDEIYLQIIVRDTTELRQTKNALNKKVQELERYIVSNKELEAFAHTTAHDLKEPLRTVGSFVMLLKKSSVEKLSSSEQSYINFISTGVENMTQLIQDLLAYSKASAELEKSFETISLKNMLDLLVYHNLRQQIEDSQAKIHFKNIPPSIRGVKAKVGQIFQNIVSNAIKFRSKVLPCEITIEAKAVDNFYLFEISDNGIGIPAEKQEQIFEVFTRLNSKKDYAGSGIGLATCKKIVQQHGGKIWVSSQLGEGATFSFTLPKA